MSHPLIPRAEFGGIAIATMHYNALLSNGVDSVEKLRALDVKSTRVWKNCGSGFRKHVKSIQDALRRRVRGANEVDT